MEAAGKIVTESGGLLPEVPGPLPGPKSAAALERLGELVYPGTSSHLAPFIIDSKTSHYVTDIDGNTFVDLVSSSASIPDFGRLRKIAASNIGSHSQTTIPPVRSNSLRRSSLMASGVLWSRR